MELGKAIRMSRLQIVINKLYKYLDYMLKFSGSIMEIVK